jgi:hypothetical protein
MYLTAFCHKTVYAKHTEYCTSMAPQLTLHYAFNEPDAHTYNELLLLEYVI